MRCPGCDNDRSTGFEFCGQCGMRLQPSDDAFVGDQLPFPPVSQSQFPNAHNLPHATPSPLAQQQQSPTSYTDNQARTTATLSPMSGPEQMSRPSNPAPRPEQPLSQDMAAPVSGFYRDATDAIMMPMPLSSGPLQQSGHVPSQPLYGFPGPTIAHHQPFLSHDPYAPTSISHPLPYAQPAAVPPSSQPSYGYVNHSQPLYGSPQMHDYAQGAVPAQKYPAQNITPLLVSICLVVTVIIIISATIIYQRSQLQASQTSASHATGMTAPLHTIGGQAPGTTLAPTPVPDAGFVWCGLECAPNNFMDEYPLGWQMSVLTGNTGIQFINPQQTDQLALLKTQSNPTEPADIILLNELQNNYANQPGYQAPNPPSGQDVTIAGETWSSSSIMYQGSNQQEEQLTAYVTVHQGKVFILEIQSAQAQFAQVSTAYYNIMIGKFQFT